MKEGKKEDAETAKTRVAEIKENQQSFTSRNGQSTGRHDQPAFYTIPNVPTTVCPAEDNVVEKWAVWKPNFLIGKKYDLIDFDLGVKITGRFSCICWRKGVFNAH